MDHRAAFVLCLVCACAAGAEQPDATSLAPTDWPRWAGPKGNCTSDEKGLLAEWPKDGPKVLWRVPVGTGSNHPSVAGDDLCYACLEDGADKETMKCLDANTGREKWHYTYNVFPQYWVGWGDLGVRATPTITDQYVYEIGTFGDAFCLERKTGKVVWKHNFREESPYLNGMGVAGAKKTNLEWKGFNGSLVPLNGKIFYFYWQGGNPAISDWTPTEVSNKMQFYAYDANTGNVAWKFEEDCKPGTRGPGLITGGGLPVTFNHEECLVVHGNREWKILRQADGKQVWHWECSGPNEAPGWACGGLSPVGPNLYTNALNGWIPSLVECDFSQADPKPKVLWTKGDIHEAVTPPVIWNGSIYGFYVDDRKSSWEMGAKPGVCDFSLRCTDLKTGTLQWKQPGFHYGLAIVAAEDRLYVHSFQRLTLVEANPKAYVEKGRVENLHNLTTGQKSLLDWSMPVIAKGRMFIRTPIELICYDIRR